MGAQLCCAGRDDGNVAKQLFAKSKTPEVPQLSRTVGEGPSENTDAEINGAARTDGDSASAIGKWKVAANHIKMAHTVTNALAPGSFNVQAAVGQAEVDAVMEEEYEALMLNWKPRTTIRTHRDSTGGAPPPDALRAEAPPAPDADLGKSVARTKSRKSISFKTAPPPPPSSADFEAEALSAAADINASSQRMDAKLKEIQDKTDAASTKLQAVARGRSSRKSIDKDKLTAAVAAANE